MLYAHAGMLRAYHPTVCPQLQAGSQCHHRIIPLRALGSDACRCRTHTLTTTTNRRPARLHEDLQRLHQQMQGVQQAAAVALQEERRRGTAAVDEERRRAGEHERAAQEASAAAASSASALSVCRAALAAAEQKASGLEAALQQSSSVTVNMTAKVAQTMADANAQVGGCVGAPAFTLARVIGPAPCCLQAAAVLELWSAHGEGGGGYHRGYQPLALHACT